VCVHAHTCSVTVVDLLCNDKIYVIKHSVSVDLLLSSGLTGLYSSCLCVWLVINPFYAHVYLFVHTHNKIETNFVNECNELGGQGKFYWWYCVYGG
jgi:hypothetical protein